MRHMKQRQQAALPPPNGEPEQIPEGLGHRDNTPICFKRYLPRDGSGKLIPNLINGNNNFHLRLSSVSAGRVHSEYNK